MLSAHDMVYILLLVYMIVWMCTSYNQNACRRVFFFYSQQNIYAFNARVHGQFELLYQRPPTQVPLTHASAEEPNTIAPNKVVSSHLSTTR